MRSDARNGRSMGLGVRRPMMGGRGRRGGKWLGRRGGWGVNRGRRGGGGRGGGRRGARRPPPPSREQLDKEIEVESFIPLKLLHADHLSSNIRFTCLEQRVCWTSSWMTTGALDLMKLQPFEDIFFLNCFKTIYLIYHCF